MLPFPLLLLGSMGFMRADICKGQWDMSLEEQKMVAKGSLSLNPSVPFVIDFNQFSELGEFAKKMVIISSIT